MKKLAIAIAAVVIPTFAFAALSPVLDNSKVFQIANRSNSATWGTTATAKPGETLTFMVHVHNNVVNTTATNVKVQATLPQNEVTNYTARATVSADNAQTVAGTVNFTLSESAKLEYVPGSTQLYHNNQVERVLPDTVTTTGVVIGDIEGCYEFERWVIFKAKVVKKQVVTPATTETEVEKIVETKGQPLPQTGPIEAVAGSLGGISLAGAGHYLRKSKKQLIQSQKTIK